MFYFFPISLPALKKRREAPQRIRILPAVFLANRLSLPKDRLLRCPRPARGRRPVERGESKFRPGATGLVRGSLFEVFHRVSLGAGVGVAIP